MQSCLRPVVNRITLGAAFALLFPWSLPATGQTLAQAQAPPATKSTASAPSAKWEKDILAFEMADKLSPPPKGAILFIGASTTRRWTTLAKDFPGYTVINRGFGGSQTADGLYFADRIVIPYKPKLIVVNYGGNDINAGKKAEVVLADFRALVEKVRAELPDTRIAFTSLSPSPKRWEQADEQRKANRLVREYVLAGKNLDYIEIWDEFLGPDGKPREDLFVDDRLHNNAAGYEIRTKVIRPHLQ